MMSEKKITKPRVPKFKNLKKTGRGVTPNTFLKDDEEGLDMNKFGLGFKRIAQKHKAFEDKKVLRRKPTNQLKYEKAFKSG